LGIGDEREIHGIVLGEERCGVQEKKSRDVGEKRLLENHCLQKDRGEVREKRG